MFSLVRPSEKTLAAWLRQQESAPAFTTAAKIPQPAPRGFKLNLGRALLGQGEDVYRAACQSLRNWKMFPGGWIDIHPGKPVDSGMTVGVLARCLGVWSLNACRVVSLQETSAGPVRSVAFTYATVGRHVYQGAEEFAVNWDQASDEVWYELASYSRARHPLIWLMSPYVRGVQRRFARESTVAMQTAVAQQLCGQG